MLSHRLSGGEGGVKIIYPEAFKINKREVAILNTEATPEPSEATNTPILVHLNGADVMLGKFKQPIGQVVKNPFSSQGNMLFMPNDTSMLNSDMLRQIADAMDRLAK